MARRQQERSVVARRRLLEAAGELMTERGYVGMTLAAVGERAGYSRGLVTVHFGSKENLLSALVDRITVDWSHRQIPEADSKSGLAGVLMLLQAIHDQFERDTRHIKLLYALMFEALGDNEFLRRCFVDFHRRQRTDIANQVRRGIKDGSIKPGTIVDDEATAIIATLRGIGYQWLLDPSGFDPGPALSHLTEATQERLQVADHVATDAVLAANA